MIGVSSIEVTMQMALWRCKWPYDDAYGLMTMQILIPPFSRENIILISPIIDALLVSFPQNNGNSTFNNQEIS